MAKLVEARIFGVDVAKGWLDIYTADQGGGVERIDNTGEAIETWLRGVTGPVWVAVEATNRYHESFIEQAHGQGHRVYVIDAFKLSRYRDAVGRRAKTDRCDAEFHRHDFRNADAFVAFIGLDVRVRDSGKFRGRRKLTKKGDPEIRRLLYNAAMCGCRLSHWKPYYRSLRDRGFSGTAALVILARKMLRVCYALLEKQVSFDPEIRKLPCNAT